MMKITLEGNIRFIRATKNNDGWVYTEGKNVIIPDTKRGPNFMAYELKEDYKKQGKEAQVVLY